LPTGHSWFAVASIIALAIRATLLASQTKRGTYGSGCISSASEVQVRAPVWASRAVATENAQFSQAMGALEA